MANYKFCRTRTINLKPILEELETDLKYSLILNSSMGPGVEEGIREDWQDYDVICGKIKTLWDIGFIRESEYAAIRRYFSSMVEIAIEDLKRTKGGK